MENTQNRDVTEEDLDVIETSEIVISRLSKNKSEDEIEELTEEIDSEETLEASEESEEEAAESEFGSEFANENEFSSEDADEQAELSPEEQAMQEAEKFRNLKLSMEALLFAAEDALSVTEISNLVGEIANAEVKAALRSLQEDYAERAFELVEVGNKWSLRTKPKFGELTKKQFQSKPKSLSKSALETLAIIAYQQPVTRAQVAAIRGCDSSSLMQGLKDKELIHVAGKRNEVGNPLEYRTTQKFLEVFGLSSLKELPSLRSLQMSSENQAQVQTALNFLDGKDDEVNVTAENLAFPNQNVEGSNDTYEEFDAPEKDIFLDPVSESIEEEEVEAAPENTPSIIIEDIEPSEAT